MTISFKSLGTAAKIQKTEVITSTQSWTVPADVSQIELIMCGGGAGGTTPFDSADTIQRMVPGGSGSVDWAVLSVTPGSSHTIAIGAGGSPISETEVSSINATPTKGGDSSFGSLFTVSGAYTAGRSNTGAGNATATSTDLANHLKPGGKGGSAALIAWNSTTREAHGYMAKGNFGLGGAGGFGVRNAFPNSSNVSGGIGERGQDGGGNGGSVGYLQNVGPANVVYGGTSGAANTGGGGGGGACSANGGVQVAGNGGSGVAIIKYWSAL